MANGWSGGWKLPVTVRAGACLLAMGVLTEPVRAGAEAPPGEVRGGPCPDIFFDHEGVELIRWMCLDEFQAAPGGFAVGQGNDVWGYTSPSGREYVLVGFDGATGFVEITDPENPVILEVAQHAAPPSLPSDIKTYGERAYVVTDNSGGGIQIFDLSQIDDGLIPAPVVYIGPLLSRFTEAHNIAIDETSGTCYPIATGGSGGGGGQGFLILDLVANPTNPPMLGEWHARSVHDMQVVTWEEGPYAGRQIAFAAASGSGLAVLDVTGGQVTELAIDLGYPGLAYCHQGWLSDDRNWFFVGDELDAGPTTTVFDVSDLDDVTYFGQFASPVGSTDHNLYVRGPFVYEANYTGGLRVFDMGEMITPEGIEEIAHFDTYPGSNNTGFLGAWGVYAGFASGTVVVSDIQRGLFLFDVTAAITPVYADATSGPLGDAAESHGAAWGDLDGDGDEDLFVANDAAPDRLYRNDGGTFVDVAPSALDVVTASRGAAFGDMDADGDLDLYVAIEDGPNRLLRNDAGTLVDASAPPVDDIASGRTVCWVDVERDGDLDLFVANHDDESRIFLNDGVGTFSTAVGLGEASRRGMGAAWADADGDGDLDLALGRVGAPNHLFTNAGDGTFTHAVVDGDVQGGITAGAAWGDVDRDGDLDLFFANAGLEGDGGQTNTLLRNDGGGAFVDVTVAMGLDGTRRTLGCAFGDYDRDGWLDLYTSEAEGGMRLERNVEGTGFASTPPANFRHAGDVHAFALADHDGNGGLDVFAANTNGPNHLYEEIGAGPHHWLAVSLEGTASNRRGIGARVEVWVSGVPRVRQVAAGSGYLSQSSAVVHVGLGANVTADSVRVVWPSGWRSLEVGVAADQRIVLSEDDATPIGDHPDVLPPGAAPRATRLYAAAPNPFNPRTRITFDLETGARVRLEIYDVNGRVVRALLEDAQRGAGRHMLAWDGRDGAGRPAASGTYFIRLVAAGVRETRRATLVR